MITPDIHYSFVASATRAAKTLEPLVSRLIHIHESRANTVRIVNSAADARRDLPFKLPERFLSLRTTGVKVGRGGSLGKITAVTERDLLNPDPESIEAQLRALLEATMVSLETTNEALEDMAATMTQQLVGEPEKLISGNDLAQMLKITEEAVRQRLQAGKLIAILSKGRERGRGFPIFQAWDGIAGAPLEQVLKAIGYEGPGKSVDAADAFQFFIGRNELLGGFTPVEVLTGAGVSDPADAEALEFLAKPHQERLEFVKSVARAVMDARDA